MTEEIMTAEQLVHDLEQNVDTDGMTYFYIFLVTQPLIDDGLTGVFGKLVPDAETLAHFIDGAKGSLAQDNAHIFAKYPGIRVALACRVFSPEDGRMFINETPELQAAIRDTVPQESVQ